MIFDRKFLTSTCAALAVVAFGATSSPQPANAANAVLGVLKCHGNGTVGKIFGSKEALNCTFKQSGNKGTDHYHATITKVGLDIGVSGPSTLMWTVMGSSSAVQHQDLIGTYDGVSAEASVAYGGGANVLVGGSKKSIVLQPVSVEGQKGLNLAVGVASLKIR